MMEVEMDTYLGYEKFERSDSVMTIVMATKINR